MASPHATIEAHETIAARLAAATVAHKDAQEVAKDAAKKWRRLIVEGIDAGMRQADVAELAGVSRARLHAILVAEYSRP